MDNACSGVSKILVALVQGAAQGGSPLLPAAQTSLALEQVLPVLLHALPIQSDHEEDKPVYVDCIGRLLHIGSGSAGGGGLAVAQEICRGPLVKLLPQVVTALVTAMPTVREPEVREGMVQALGVAMKQFGVPPQQLVAGLKQAEVQWLQSVC